MALLHDLSYRRPFAWAVLWPLLWLGVAVFRVTGRTPWLSYWAMRRLYCVTRGRSNQWLARTLGAPVAVGSASADGVLASMNGAHRDASLDALRRDGFAVLGTYLRQAQIDSLVDFARATPARLIPAPTSGPTEHPFDPDRPRAIKNDLPEDRLVEHPVVQSLLADHSLRDFARRYHNSEPVNDHVAMWWSSAYSSEASSEVAQLYHFDMDRPQFLKLFFYLTDVTPDTGPHCYIRASHRERPAALWRDGRHADEDVLALYGRASEVEIAAPRGTLIAVDTSGFHKGKPLVQGSRLLLQLEYTSALFGQKYAHLRVPRSEFWTAQLLADPSFFARFSF